jgi:NAD(P)-dependent dehydrogenase (short-subunit alcohol dehydrogenase family)
MNSRPQPVASLVDAHGRRQAAPLLQNHDQHARSFPARRQRSPWSPAPPAASAPPWRQALCRGRRRPRCPRRPRRSSAQPAADHCRAAGRRSAPHGTPIVGRAARARRRSCVAVRICGLRPVPTSSSTTPASSAGRQPARVHRGRTGSDVHQRQPPPRAFLPQRSASPAELAARQSRRARSSTSPRCCPSRAACASPAYTAAKSALAGLTRAMANELAPARHQRQRHRPGLHGHRQHRRPAGRPRAQARPSSTASPPAAGARRTISGRRRGLPRRPRPPTTCMALRPRGRWRLARPLTPTP